ncbi:hypothetical protein ACL598_16960 [Bordetella bronchialis]|uniref:hypothetical protein n=1 Tax=Bordetella bronchialis TaxID=463025 RepID=UPI003D0633D4
MAIKHCEMCDRQVQTRRKIGVGTLLLVLVTLGWWLLTIPFYRQRCPICWGDQFGELRAGVVKERMDARKARERGLILVVVVVAVVGYVVSRQQGG